VSSERDVKPKQRAPQRHRGKMAIRSWGCAFGPILSETLRLCGEFYI
jgi:hypothetical protein